MYKVLIESEKANDIEIYVDDLDEIFDMTLPSDAWIWVNNGFGYIELSELYNF